jgi:hypothetical protein
MGQKDLNRDFNDDRRKTLGKERDQIRYHTAREKG